MPPSSAVPPLVGQLHSRATDAELLDWYREAYQAVERNCTVAWAAASRMRHERDKWQIIAAVVTALLVLLAAHNVWSWWLT